MHHIETRAELLLENIPSVRVFVSGMQDNFHVNLSNYHKKCHIPKFYIPE